MASLRDCLFSIDPPVNSAAAQALRLGIQSPVSLSEMILACDIRIFEQVIVTPPGTALGGFVKLRISGDGRFTFSGHMHGSGFDPYKFSVHVFLEGSESWVGLSMRKTGAVGGTLGGGSRDFDWSDSGISPALKANWKFLRDGQLLVTKSYEDTGLLGTAEEIGQTLVTFLIANAIIGPLIAAVIIIGPELAHIAEVQAPPDLFAGLLIAGGTIALLGPGMLIPGLVAAYAVGSTISCRHLNEEEKAVARIVFDNTLPFDRIWLTDLKMPNDPDRAFCTFQPDGAILVNLGDDFAEPIKFDGRKVTLIHELVHAWQCVYAGVDPEMIWQLATNPIVGASVYKFEYAGERWEDMNLEAQASAVATWFAVFGKDPETPPATSVPIFDYIANHIRLGAG